MSEYKYFGIITLIYLYLNKLLCNVNMSIKKEGILIIVILFVSVHRKQTENEYDNL